MKNNQGLGLHTGAGCLPFINSKCIYSRTHVLCSQPNPEQQAPVCHVGVEALILRPHALPRLKTEEQPQTLYVWKVIRAVSGVNLGTCLEFQASDITSEYI